MNSIFHTLGIIKYFLAKLVSRCPTFTFQLSIMSKWFAKSISTKVSFEFSIRKRHVNIEISWPWIWNQYFYLAIWNDDRTKIIVLQSFQLVTRISSQKRNENEFINVLCFFNLCMNIGNSNWHNWSFDPTSMNFFTLFKFLTRFLTSKYLKLFSTYLVGRNGAMWKTCFSTFQIAKKISWNIESKCITDSLWTVRSTRMKDYTCHYEVST